MIRLTLPLVIVGIAFGGETHKFSHFEHVKTEELECSDCHKKTIQSSTLADARVGLTLKSCVKCHEEDSAFKSPKPIVLSDANFKIQRAEGKDLKFDHKAHISSKVECAACHGEIASEETAAQLAGTSGENLLGMKSCMECHVRKAEVSCLTCHTKVNKPTDHLSALWLRGFGHGQVSDRTDQDCAMCHEKGEVTTCAECHMGSDARKVHGFNYRFNHGIDVKFKKSDCAVCHAPVDQFCSDCHEGKGRKLR